MRRRMEVNGGVILRVTEKFALLMVLCACWALRDPLFLVDHGALRVLTGWVIVTSIVLAPVIAGVFFLPLRAMYRNSLPDAKS